VPETDNTGADKDQQLPEKYRGKSAAEIAAMHADLETKLGQQGAELGELRTMVADLSARQAASTREPASKSDYTTSKYSRYAEELIVSPEEALPKLMNELRADLRAELASDTSQQLSQREAVEGFFRANPELAEYREIVSVIGERIYQQNPNMSLPRLFEETRKASLQYISSLKERMDRKGKDADRARNAITTSGGRAREGVGGEEAGRVVEAVELSEVDKAIAEAKAFREKRLVPPRASR